MAKDKEIKVVDVADYSIMQADARDQIDGIMQIMRDDPDAYDVDARVLDVIKAPAGGAKYFDLPGGPAASFDCVFLFMTARRAWFEQAFEDGGGAPPVCSGENVEVRLPGEETTIKEMRGRGKGVTPDNPLGRCSVCPHAEFVGDERPVCGEQLQIFALTPDSVMPVIIQVPVTSIKIARKYVGHNVFANQLQYHGYVTRVGLTIQPNANGVDFAKFTFDFVAPVPKEHTPKIKGMIDGFKPLFKKAQVAQ